MYSECAVEIGVKYNVPSEGMPYREGGIDPVIKFPITWKSFKFGVPAKMSGIAPVNELKLATNVSAVNQVRACIQKKPKHNAPVATYLDYREPQLLQGSDQKYQDFEKLRSPLRNRCVRDTNGRHIVPILAQCTYLL